MIVQIALLVTAVKLLFVPLYHSTDFEVHRNWLAITHNLTTAKWYYEDTSSWTLDYPPFFAWFEFALSQIAKYFDPRMLDVNNLNYDSQMTVLFQRLSVTVLDVIFIASVKSCSNLIGNGKLLVYILLISNPGLLMVDHIHFQYNGFLYGILLFSISHMIRANFLQAAFWFAVLLNFKHIYLYIAPVYVVYLLRAYCFTLPAKDGVNKCWNSFSVKNFVKLGFTVLFVFGLSFGPFLDHLPQVLFRLFPFQRGLCHAYWAPNFWALYNIADKLLQYALPLAGFNLPRTQACMTGGLVMEYDHVVLISISPIITFLLSVVSMLPALVHLWHLGADQKYRGVNFIRCIIICATCSFMFGWHVHEKAILMILIPLSFMAVLGDMDGKMFLILSTVGHYSLFPLIYPKNLLPLKVFMLLTHSAIAFRNIPLLYEKCTKKQKKRGLSLRFPMLNIVETIYLVGLLELCLYEHVIHPALGLERKWPFLPLMLTSVYCAVGVFYFWITYYYYFMTFQLSPVATVAPQSVSEAKKTK